jgi:hypothetical protein
VEDEPSSNEIARSGRPLSRVVLGPNCPTVNRGFSPKGVEDNGEILWRKDFLRQIGYKQSSAARQCKSRGEIVMKSVERLMAEHELIERGLSLLEDAIIKTEDGQALPDGFSEWVVRFFQQFADQCHHTKEEDVFFPVLKQRGILEKGGPIGVMLYEHELGRDCVSRMREASQARTVD